MKNYNNDSINYSHNDNNNDNNNDDDDDDDTSTLENFPFPTFLTMSVVRTFFSL